MLAKVLILWCLLFCTLYANGAELVLQGVYQGKDIYVQNPFSRAEQRFCTISVFVNDRQVISQPKTSAFRISLAHFDLRDIIVIRINYRDDCQPKIINPEVIQPVKGFEFLTAQATRQSVSWLSKGELPGGAFRVERKAGENEWHLVQKVNGKGNAQASNYETHVNHLGGRNLYRIKYEGVDSVEAYSITFSYNFEEAPITFYPEMATTKLYLSEESEYEITDAYGKVFRRGKGRIINIQTLEPGEYFLHIKDQSLPFTKKDL